MSGKRTRLDDLGGETDPNKYRPPKKPLSLPQTAAGTGASGSTVVAGPAGLGQSSFWPGLMGFLNWWSQMTDKAYARSKERKAEKKKEEEEKRRRDFEDPTYEKFAGGERSKTKWLRARANTAAAEADEKAAWARGAKADADSAASAERKTSVASDAVDDVLKRFYTDGGFAAGSNRDDWLEGDRFEDTLAGKATKAAMSQAAYGRRRDMYNMAFQRGLGDPTLARGSHLRQKAYWKAVSMASQERRAAEKERADAYYNWMIKNGRSPVTGGRLKPDEEETQSDYLGGVTGWFRSTGKGHRRVSLAPPDKLDLVARSFA